MSHYPNQQPYYGQYGSQQQQQQQQQPPAPQYGQQYQGGVVYGNGDQVRYDATAPRTPANQYPQGPSGQQAYPPPPTHQNSYGSSSSNSGFGTPISRGQSFHGATQHSQPPTYNPQAYAQQAATQYNQTSPTGYPQQQYAAAAPYQNSYNPATYQKTNAFGIQGAQYVAYPSPGGPNSALVGRAATVSSHHSVPSPPTQYPNYGQGSPQIPPPPPPPPKNALTPEQTSSPSYLPHGQPPSSHSAISNSSKNEDYVSYHPGPSTGFSPDENGRQVPPYGNIPTPPIPSHSSSSNPALRNSAHPLPPPPTQDEPTPPAVEHSGISFHQTAEEQAHEDIVREVELALARAGSSKNKDRTAAAAPEVVPPKPPKTSASTVNIVDDDEDSDPEAAAGMAALRMADEEEEARIQRRNTLLGNVPPINTTKPNAAPVNHLPYPVDMGMFEGGFGAPMSYDTLDYGDSSESRDESRPLPSMNDIRRNTSGRKSEQSGSSSNSSSEPVPPSPYDYYPPEDDSLHPFPQFKLARVDTSGTGGLSLPTPHRRKMSFDQDDEVLSYTNNEQNQASGTPLGNDISDFSYYPPTTTANAQRPLPEIPIPPQQIYPSPPPLGGVIAEYQPSAYASQYQLDAYHAGYPDAVPQSPSSPLFARHQSLSAMSTQPVPYVPERSKTDANAHKRARPVSARYNSAEAYYGAPPSASVDLPIIPVGRRKMFDPSKLSSQDFDKCLEPWALSAVANWLQAVGDGETDLKEKILEEAVVVLFTHKVPTMNTADAEVLAARIVQDMLQAGRLVKEEEWVRFGEAEVSGVIWQVSGHGCYSPKLHESLMAGRCYSHYCSRTLKKIVMQVQIGDAQVKGLNWVEQWKITKEDIADVNKKEVERQNVLQEIVNSEDEYMTQLLVLRLLYRDHLRSWQPPIIPPSRIENFIREVFGKLEAVKKVNEDYLLPQLKYRQREQGPWVNGFSDCFREWIRKARGPYLEYSGNFPNANRLVRKEAENNLHFNQFLEQARNNNLSQRLGWDTFLKAPITRLQRYGLLLDVVLKNSTVENEEKNNLKAAIEEIKAVTQECNDRVDEVTRGIELREFSSRLVLRPGMDVELNLGHLGRELVFKGDLQRQGGNKFSWLDVYAILFDHYLVLAKTEHGKDSTSKEKYDVSKLPIPMDLLVLESAKDDPVVKSTVKGITAVSSSSRMPSNAMAPVSHVSTNSSVSSNSSASSGKTILPPPSDEKILYPFRIRHLGKSENYTLFASSAINRQEWCEAIIKAKTKHAASLFKQNAEPFRLRVMADSAFAGGELAAAAKTALIEGTPLWRSIREVEDMFQGSGPRPAPVCKATVNCATTFFQPYGRQMIAIGTDMGVYISEFQNPRGWFRAVSTPKVTQIAVIEQFSLFIILADKTLTAHHLDSVCPVSGVAPPPNDSIRRAPQKLSPSRDVGFFQVGNMKDRVLLLYKKRDGFNSIFKVLEPVYHKATEKRSLFHHKKGSTEHFREFDQFYIPSECFALNVFSSSLSVCSARGFEVLTLDKKQSWSVPDLKAPHVSNIAARVANQRPLGMFKLNDQEFLLCYEEVGVYTNKFGEVSRSVIMEFLGKAKSAVLHGAYVLLFDNDFVEVRNAQNGRLRQVIAGRNIRCIEDGVGDNRTVKLALQHPNYDGMQLIVELLLNEGQKD